MEKRKVKTEVHVGSGDHLTVEITKLVELREDFVLFTENGPVTLEAKITVNLSTIPEQYHEVMLNMLSTKYMNKVSFTDNPFSQYKLNAKKPWWKFWS